MPRDGSDQYSIPPGTNGVPDTTIESAKYNAFAADLEVDLNHPRPIVAGGTGANNAHDAMIALSGEIAGQAVDNYDSFPFVNGSFHSVPGATNAPDNPGGSSAAVITGICYGAETNSPTLEARNLSAGGASPPKYIRQRLGATWGAWTLLAGSTADLDAAYVNVAGDTMTGPLIVSPSFEINGYGQPLLSFKGLSGATGDQRMSFLYDPGTALSAPGVVIQNQADAGGFISNSGVLWRDGALSLGDIARPNGGAGGLRVASTAASSSPTTGALTVAGGVGVSGALVANGVVQGGQLNLTSGPVTAFSGNYHVFYGPGSRDGLFIGDTANTANLNIYRADSHAFQDRAGAATKGAVYVGCATASSSPTTGALTVAGGVGVQGGLNAGMPSSFTNPTDNKAIVFTHDAGFTYIQSLNAAQNASANMSITGLYSGNMAQLRLMADQVYMGGTTASTSTATGALTVAGGVGVAGNINASSLIASGGNFWAQVTPTTGTYHFGTSGLKYLSYDGTSFTLTGGNLQTTGSVVATGALDTTYNTDASVVTATVAAASLITIVTNFSGVIMTTCHQTGITELFLCGAGQVARLGGSGGALTSVTVNAAPPQLGYSLTNTTGATGTFSVIKLRTRSTY